MIPVIGTIVNRLRKAIAIVEDGDTASQTIAKGKYIVWKGELCQTDSAIPQGSTFATSGAGKNLTAKTEGLGGEIATLNSKITTQTLSATKSNKITTVHKNQVYVTGNIVTVCLMFDCEALSQYDLMFTLPVTMKDYVVATILINGTNYATTSFVASANGTNIGAGTAISAGRYLLSFTFTKE